MKIDGRFHLHDGLSGMTLTVVEGEHMDRLHIEFSGERIVSNRDFWFLKDGRYDGAGSGCGPVCDEDEPPAGPRGEEQ